MMTEWSVWHFAAMLLCAFLTGAAGAWVVLLLNRKKNQKSSQCAPCEPKTGTRTARRIVRTQRASAWQGNARDEQLYNGR